MHGDDLHRRIEAHRAAERQREAARVFATSEAAAELQRMVQELQAIQRSTPEARSLEEPVFVAGTAPIVMHSEEVSGVDSDWRAGPGRDPPHIRNIVGLYTVSYNPVGGVWLTQSRLGTVAREEVIDLFKDALAKWIALEYPKEVRRKRDEQTVKKAEQEKQQVFIRLEKDKQRRDLFGWVIIFLVSFALWTAMRSADVVSMSLADGLFSLLVGFWAGIIAFFSALFTIRAAFIYLFD